ncbi:hypothetical protein IV01_09605 [Pseudomonas syringae]|uniref:Uncharacterized protein n=1 Tax=Pseudomonas syringae TaxID=317 RepID=A0A085VL97_PSESX|nr:hypothetical protein IV01_09605 [Pseudomonas syringae]
MINVTSDLLVEDEQAGGELGRTDAYRLAMLFEHRAALGFSFHTTLAQSRIAQHVSDWHPGRFEAAQKLNPDQDRGVIVTLVRTVTFSIGK